MTRALAVRSVLFVGGRRTEAMEAAHRAGMTISYLGPKSGLSERRRELVASALLVPDMSADHIVKAAIALHSVQPFDLAMTMNDDFLQAAARINHELGLLANPLEAVTAVTDKAFMRELLRDSEVGQVAAASVRSAYDLRMLPRTIPLPVILKPTRGTASQSIHVIHDTEQLDALARELDFSVPAEDTTPPWLAEEFLDGAEFSVETFSMAGRHHLLAVTEKFKTANFVEIGHLVPARTPAEQQDRIVAEVITLLTALGVQEGPAHTEVMLTARGPRIIETHTRPGGDAIVELVRLASGFDIQQLTFSWLAGEPVDLTPEPVAGAAAIWFLTVPEGKVTAVGGLAEASAAEGVVTAVLTAAVGDLVPPLHNSWARQGDVIAIGDDPDTALQRARQGVGRFTVEVEPPSAPAF
ncbi:ATP-grasp domain-containing protein [Kitasatospora sp. NPDC052896]|uniref:ATP-grasp domain-containing protein n=1 Tax=Kitasatospora sp. NPDC052896 TaxID=3364061 RepID=UPI0037CA40AE